MVLVQAELCRGDERIPRPNAASGTVAFTAGALTAPGAVLLLSCYELGHQPLSLASPMAVLRQAGFAPVAVDTAVEELADETIQAANLVAISVPMHTALRLGARLAERVRIVNPAAHVCFYGLYATLNADYLLRRQGDSVIGGEYEAALLRLVEAIDRGDAAAVPGVGTQAARAAPALERVPLAVPARDTLPPLRRYAGLERDGQIVRAGYVEATRGCHHTCLHCPVPPIYGGRFFAVPREIVLADARAQIAAGARHLTFGDPDFFNGPTHGLRILRELHHEFPALTFDATIKVEHLLQHRRLLPELAALGCAFVVSAVESLSELVLVKLDKGHTRTDVEAALTELDAVGIPMRPSLLVPPGSALLAEPAAAAWLGDLDANAFTYRWLHPDVRLDDLQRRVATIVEEGAARDEDAAATFARIWHAAHAVAGGKVPPVPPPRERRARAPRLTESWFC